MRRASADDTCTKPGGSGVKPGRSGRAVCSREQQVCVIERSADREVLTQVDHAHGLEHREFTQRQRQIAAVCLGVQMSAASVAVTDF
jgi:hypothetical protein